MLKLVLGASPYDRSSGPKRLITVADALNTIRRIFAPYLCRQHVGPIPFVGAQLLCKHPTTPVPRPRRRRTWLSKPTAHGEPSDVQVPVVAVGLITFE